MELDEDIPTGWTVARTDSAGAIFDTSDLRWTWPSVSAGETKTVSYDVTVHSNATEGSYPISGEISATNETRTSIGGDTEIKVDKIYVNDDAYETEYKIKIATYTGLIADITVSSPLSL